MSTVLRRGVSFLPARWPRLVIRTRVRTALERMGAVHPSWDPALARELLDRLDLDPEARIPVLFDPVQAGLSLVLALASRPTIAILEEPPGLPHPELVDHLGSIAGELGAAVLLSNPGPDSLPEEPGFDRITILGEGRAIATGSLEELRDRTGLAGGPLEAVVQALERNA